MSFGSFIQTLQEAIDERGMTQVPVADRTRLVSDNGRAYVSLAIDDANLLGL